MSDNDSFVILESSFMASLETDGNSVGVHKVDASADKSQHPDSAGSDLQIVPTKDPKETTSMNYSNLTASLNDSKVEAENSSSSSFIIGDINADVLKTGVNSQLPNISMNACAEDVELQTMFANSKELQTSFEKVNNLMKIFNTNSMQWKEKMSNMEEHYKSELIECQKKLNLYELEKDELKKSIEEKMEQTKAVDIARQKDREDMIKIISEKTSLNKNMRAQIVKLEQQLNATSEFVPKKPDDQKSDDLLQRILILERQNETLRKDFKKDRESRQTAMGKILQT